MRSYGHALRSVAVGYLLAFHGIWIATVTWSISCIFVRCALPEPCSAVSSTVSSMVTNTTPLEIVFASVGQTGTTSVMEAVRQMGYRSYHIEEKILFTSDVLADLSDAQQLVPPLSRCGVQAMSLEPTVDVLPYVVETSPNARYILTWRDYPGWVLSTITAGYAKDDRWGYIARMLYQSVQYVPWIHLYDAVTGGFADLVARGEPFAGEGQGSIKSFMSYKIFGVYDSPLHNTKERGTFKTGGHEEGYLAQINEIRQLVPHGRLLEFDVRRHGWKELAGFLGRPAPPGRTPFPHTRSRDSRTNDINVYRDTTNVLSACFIWSILHAINFTIFLAAVRAAAHVASRVAEVFAWLLSVVADCSP